METWTRPKVGHLIPTKWGWLVSYPDNLYIGEWSDIGAFTYIQAKHGVHIGQYVQIGSHCSIYSADTIGSHYGFVELRPNCRIGSHSVILPNVTIGKGVVIPAYSLIKKSVYGPEDFDNIIVQG